ncbi:hypothetical protein ABBQ32_011134 [Trebouxia sp. C0010 RCD-2024]
MPCLSQSKCICLLCATELFARPTLSKPAPFPTPVRFLLLQLSYYAYPHYTCGSSQHSSETDTVAVASNEVLKGGDSCYQCIQVDPSEGDFPSFTAELIGQADGINGTDLGIPTNYGGVYSMSWKFIDCSSSTKLLGASSAASPSSSQDSSDSTPTPSPTSTPSPSSHNSFSSSVKESKASSPSPTPTPSSSDESSSTSSKFSSSSSTSSSSSSSTPPATCTGDGTYYSEVKGSGGFHCIAHGKSGGYPGLPTVALNGPDLDGSDLDSCGKCIVLRGSGISAHDAAAQGMGTTPFPGSATYATINNRCGECKHCDIDYYVSYPQTMNGRYRISWSYIDCETALSEYNKQTGGSRKLLKSSRPLDGPLSQDLLRL